MVTSLTAIGRRASNRAPHLDHFRPGSKKFEEHILLLRVFGRLPVTGVTARTEAGVRKASREETAAGVFAPAVLSGYGDLAPAF